jgi:hypothetical protein
MSRWGVVLSMAGAYWAWAGSSPLVLGLIRDKGRLLRSQVNLFM